VKYVLTASWDGPALSDNDQGNVRWLVAVTIAEKVFGDAGRQIDIQTGLVEMPQRVPIYVDGSSSGKIAFMVGEGFSAQVGPTVRTLPQQVTNNEAEYLAVIAAFDFLGRMTKEKPYHYRGPYVVRCDSLLVIQQINGDWAIRDPKLFELCRQVRELRKNIDVTFEWIPREQNKVGKWLE